MTDPIKEDTSPLQPVTKVASERLPEGAVLGTQADPVTETDPKSDHPNYPFETEKPSVPERLREIAAALRVSSPSGVESLADELAMIAGEM